MSRETARYDYTAGSRGGGAIEYDDGQKLHNHDDSNPARGQVNAFDLTRIHLYGHLDKDAGDLPMGERPSYRAMCEFAQSLPEIRAARGNAELQAPEPANDDSWMYETAPATANPFRVIEAREFAGSEYIEPDWQVHELVPKVGSGLDVGDSQTWKSFKTFELAAAIHRGVPYCGRPVQKGRSVIVVAEGAHGYPLRMQAYAKHHGVPIDELPAIIPAAPNLFDPRQIEALIEQLKIRGATYVAIDTKWRCSLGAEENSAKDNAIVFGSIERIAREVGCFCTAISHTGLSDGTRVRGSSSQFAAVDVVVVHERVGDYGTSTCTKLKDAQDGAVFTVKMLSVELGVSRKTGKPFGSLVVEHVDNVLLTKAVKLPQPGTLARTAFDAVKAAIVKAGGAIDMEAARAAVVATKSEPEPGETDRRGSRAGREIDNLVSQKLLYRVNRMISDTELIKGGADAGF
jgi:AAA domain